jgi:hypothetical protein
MDGTALARRSEGSVVTGLSVASLGHLLAVAAMCVGWWYAGGNQVDEMAAGGKFAVTFYSILTYVIAQLVLFAACLATSLLSLRNRWRFGVGVVVGWGAGVLAAIVFAVALFAYAGSYSAG